MSALDPRMRDLLTGLAPASGAACARCDGTTVALANGRGRVEICARCGTLDVHAQEGTQSWNLRANLASMDLAPMRRRARSP